MEALYEQTMDAQEGVIYYLLDQMTEQHIKEVLVAYFILLSSGAAFWPCIGLLLHFLLLRGAGPCRSTKTHALPGHLAQGDWHHLVGGTARVLRYLLVIAGTCILYMPGLPGLQGCSDHLMLTLHGMQTFTPYCGMASMAQP